MATLVTGLQACRKMIKALNFYCDKIFKGSPIHRRAFFMFRIIEMFNLAFYPK